MNYDPGKFQQTPVDAQVAQIPPLFQPLSIASVTLKNRICVAPMYFLQPQITITRRCMYSSTNGHVSDFHKVHIPHFAIYGTGLILMEATAIDPPGRITSSDLGIWDDAHIPRLKELVEIVKEGLIPNGKSTVLGIQLAHAGRKGSTYPPFIREGHSRGLEVGYRNFDKEFVKDGYPCTTKSGVIEGYQVVAPSPIPYNDKMQVPHELTVEEIEELVEKFGKAAERADKAGFDTIEIHGAHGYLIHQFLSPISNKRIDAYKILF